MDVVRERKQKISVVPGWLFRYSIEIIVCQKNDMQIWNLNHHFTAMLHVSYENNNHLQYVRDIRHHYFIAKIALKCLHSLWFNTLRPRQNGRHFPDDIFKSIFSNENVQFSIKISLKFVPKDPTNTIPALVQIMALAPVRRQVII